MERAVKLKDFREQTKDLPDNADIWVLDEGEAKAWKMPGSLEVIETQHRFNASSPIPDSMKKQIEVRIRLPK